MKQLPGCSQQQIRFILTPSPRESKENHNQKSKPQNPLSKFFALSVCPAVARSSRR